MARKTLRIPKPQPKQPEPPSEEELNATVEAELSEHQTAFKEHIQQQKEG